MGAQSQPKLVADPLNYRSVACPQLHRPYAARAELDILKGRSALAACGFDGQPPVIPPVLMIQSINLLLPVQPD